MLSKFDADREACNLLTKSMSDPFSIFAYSVDFVSLATLKILLLLLPPIRSNEEAVGG
jgi:hypothetical protein